MSSGSGAGGKKGALSVAARLREQGASNSLSIFFIEVLREAIHSGIRCNHRIWSKIQEIFAASREMPRDIWEHARMARLDCVLEAVVEGESLHLLIRTRQLILVSDVAIVHAIQRDSAETCRVQAVGTVPDSSLTVWCASTSIGRVYTYSVCIGGTYLFT